MEERFPILWHSNAPWASTGYGQQSALFGPRFMDRLGYPTAFSAFYGLKGNRLGWQSPSGTAMHVYPGGTDPYANDMVTANAAHWFNVCGVEQGMVFLLTDPWVMDPKVMAKTRTLAWIPVDHDPLIPLTQDWLETSGAVPLAMSEFGVRVMQEAGFDPLYAPHGYDPRIYHPGNKKAARDVLQLPQDAFLVGMVAANVGTPSRKCFSEAFQAFARFQKTHCDDAVLYLHTKLDNGSEGENLRALAHACGIKPLASDQYGLKLGTPSAFLSLLYQAFDVLLNPAQGEGFGCTMLEAQACGCPVITTDFSACPEVAPAAVGNWNVETHRAWTWFESWQAKPDVEALEDALVEAHEESYRDQIRRAASVANWAASNYTADDVTEKYFRPALTEAWARLERRDVLREATAL